MFFFSLTDRHQFDETDIYAAFCKFCQCKQFLSGLVHQHTVHFYRDSCLLRLSHSPQHSFQIAIRGIPVHMTSSCEGIVMFRV